MRSEAIQAAQHHREDSVVAENQEYHVELKEPQHKYLEAVADRHNLPDASKAVRCLINYAIDHPDKEREIFEEIRCLDC